MLVVFTIYWSKQCIVNIINNVQPKYCCNNLYTTVSMKHNPVTKFDCLYLNVSINAILKKKKTNENNNKTHDIELRVILFCNKC